MNYFEPDILIHSKGVLVKNAILPITHKKLEPYKNFFEHRRLPYNDGDRRLGLWQYWHCYFKGIEYLRQNPDHQMMISAVKIRLPVVPKWFQNRFIGACSDILLRPFIGKVAIESERRVFSKAFPLSICCGHTNGLLVEPVPLIAWTCEDQASFLATLDPKIPLISQSIQFEIVYTDMPIPMRGTKKKPKIDLMEYRRLLKRAYQIASFTI